MAVTWIAARIVQCGLRRVHERLVSNFADQIDVRACLRVVASTLRIWDRATERAGDGIKAVWTIAVSPRLNQQAPERFPVPELYSCGET